MKKTLFVILIGLLCVTTTPAFAMTQQEIQSKIQELIQKVQVLQAQLSAPGSTSASVTSLPTQEKKFCFNFNQNLTVGDGTTGRDGKDADVLALQTILEKEGLSIDESEQKGGAVFGESTAAAVVKFQGAHGVIQTGYVGPLTRAALNALYGCEIVTTTPSITIVSPNGGETYHAGDIMTVKLSFQSMPNYYTYSAYLLDVSGNVTELRRGDSDASWTYIIPNSIVPGAYKFKMVIQGNNISISDTSDNYFNIVSQGGTATTTPSCVALPTCAQGYTPGDSYIDANGCTSFKCVLLPVVAACSNGQQTVSEGPLGNPGGTGPFEKLGMDVSAHPEILKYRIQWFNGVWSDWYVPGINDRDWKDNLDGTPRRVWSYFDDHTHEYVRCGNPTPINPPVVSGVSGPQQLTIGTQGTWKINAYDPNSNGGNLSYSVVWGDENTCRSGAVCAMAMAQMSQQTALFTHVYTTAGIYNPVFTVTNNSNQTAQTSITVQVINPNVVVDSNPVINPIAVPSVVLLGKSTKFSFSATDVDGDDLSWSILWGDGTPSSAGACAMNPTSGSKRNWTYSDSHTWQNTGTYPVSVSVSDCKGGVTASSFNVDVFNPTVFYPTTPSSSTPIRIDATPIQL